MIRIKRIYDAPSADDGARFLVDRLWPRGVTKERAALTAWCKDVAPSNELRTWFHAEGDWDAFVARYRLELGDADLSALRAAAAAGPVTLLIASKNMVENHAIVLKDALEE